jgi:hypothetical protein
MMMRRYTFLLLLIGPLAIAQTPITWHITFDPGADRAMDSLNGCWQIGAPDKTVFDPAWSAPNALVTDTVLPYPVGGISYAEFSVPMNFFAEAGVLTFRHALDMDTAEAAGWIEYYDAQNAQTWVKVDDMWGNNGTLFFQWTGAGTDTDTALVFTGNSSGWVSTKIEWYCTLVVLMEPGLRMSYPDSLRFRFAFQGLANTNGRDGWMIDDLVVTNTGCPGSIHESGLGKLEVFPNPTTDRITIELTDAPSSPMSLELFRADGAMVLRERMKSTRHALDIAALPDGPYLIRITGDYGQLVERLVIQR